MAARWTIGTGLKLGLSVSGLIATVAMLGACGGRASPEVTVTCTTSPSVSAGFVTRNDASLFFLASKSIVVQDPATGGGPTPGNNVELRVFSPFTGVTICKGNCLDAIGTFSNDVDLETDGDGVLFYTLQFDPSSGPVTGDVLEFFNSVSQCKTSVTMTVTTSG